jgi:hypothetical protein
MRRRMQGLIRQGTQNVDNNNCKEQDRLSLADNKMGISKDQFAENIDGLVNTNVQAGLTVGRQDTEMAEELIGKVIEQYQQQLSQQQQLFQQQQLLLQQLQQQQSQQQQIQTQQQQQPGQKDQNKLQVLIAKLLLGGDSGSQQMSGQETENPILAANDRSLQQNVQQGNQQQDQQMLQTDLTGKIAAQVLSEAQYELANELEASLNKLRAVIDESKQIAQKISTILEQNGGGNGTNGN